MHLDSGIDEFDRSGGDGVASSTGATAAARLMWTSPVEAAVDISCSDGQLDVGLSGEMCTWSASRVSPVVTAVTTALAPSAIELDLSAVTFFDARAVRLVVQLQQLAGTLGASFRLVGVSEAAARTLATCDIDISGLSAPSGASPRG